MHLMCIIQIWATCTCSSAQKCVENHVSLGACLGAIPEMAMNFKHLGIVAQPQTLRNLVFKFLYIQNLSKVTKTWHGVMQWHEHVVVIIRPIWGRFWNKLLTRSLVVPIENMSPCGRNNTRCLFSP